MSDKILHTLVMPDLEQWFSRCGPRTPGKIFSGVLQSQKSFHNDVKICLFFFLLHQHLYQWLKAVVGKTVDTLA